MKFKYSRKEIVTGFDFDRPDIKKIILAKESKEEQSQKIMMEQVKDKPVSDTKLIKLTKGYFTKIDSEDYERVSKHSWYSHIYKDGHVRAKSCISHKNILLSRFIMNFPIDMYVDHINRNPLDNRKCNLRVCTPSENQYNRLATKNNKTGYKGIFKNGNKWGARMVKQGKLYVLSRAFLSLEDAITAYNIKSKELFGEFGIQHDYLTLISLDKK